MSIINIFAKKKFLPNFSFNLRSKIINILEKRKIKTYENSKVQTANANKILLDTNKSFSTNITFIASGVNPSNIFEKSNLITEKDKDILVNKYLQSIEYDEIFGGGDCICFKNKPLDKVGVYAVRQNPVLLHNLMAAFNKNPLSPLIQNLIIF